MGKKLFRSQWAVAVMLPLMCVCLASCVSTEEKKKEEKKEDRLAFLHRNEKKKNNKGMKTVWISAAVTLVVGLGAGYLVGKEQGRDLPATSRHYSNNKVIATVGDVKIREKELKETKNA